LVCFEDNFDVNLAHFSRGFGSILVYFEDNFDVNLVCFLRGLGSILVCFWCDVGVIGANLSELGAL